MPHIPTMKAFAQIGGLLATLALAWLLGTRRWPEAILAASVLLVSRSVEQLIR